MQFLMIEVSEQICSYYIFKIIQYMKIKDDIEYRDVHLFH